MKIRSAFKGRRLTGAILIAWTLMAACENTEADIEAVTGKRTTVEEAWKVETIYSEGGKLKAVLTSPYMKHYLVDSPYFEFPKTLHVDFYADSLVKETTLDARYGRFNEAEKKVYLNDSVVVINRLKGDTVYCNDLWWDQQKEIIYTDKKVRIRTKTEIIDGMGMNAKQNFTEWNILNGSGTLKFRDEDL